MRATVGSACPAQKKMQGEMDGWMDGRKRNEEAMPKNSAAIREGTGERIEVKGEREVNAQHCKHQSAARPTLATCTMPSPEKMERDENRFPSTLNRAVGSTE